MLPRRFPIPVRPGARQCVTRRGASGGSEVSDSADSRIGSDVSGTASDPGLPLGWAPHVLTSPHLCEVVVLHLRQGCRRHLRSVSECSAPLGVWPSSVCLGVAGGKAVLLWARVLVMGKWHSK